MPRKHSGAHAADAARGSTLWALDGLPDRAAHELERWLDALAGLTLDEWRAVGRQCLLGDAASPNGSESDASLEATIARRDLVATAWFVRDLVETATYPARAEAARASAAARRELDRAIAAAEAAALAIAAQDWLPSSAYRELRAPFQRLDRANVLRLG